MQITLLLLRLLAALLNALFILGGALEGGVGSSLRLPSSFLLLLLQAVDFQISGQLHRRHARQSTQKASDLHVALQVRSAAAHDNPPVAPHNHLRALVLVLEVFNDKLQVFFRQFWS